ncbi:MAG: peptidoglycan -binding protein [Alphaproteobacteria bacterium]
MAGRSRKSRQSIEIWPGFVDALSSLLIILLFVLMIFMAAQYFQSSALSSRDTMISSLNRRIAELADQLSLETRRGDEQRRSAADLNVELRATIEARNRLIEDRNRLVEERGKLVDERSKLQEENRGLSSRVTGTQADLDAEKKLSTEQQSQLALLNQQIAELRRQMAAVQEALEASEAKIKDKDVQIKDLGGRLNVALAARVNELQRYRSEFFGQLRQILGGRGDVRIVGDRFVFQSEVLFPAGSAELQTAGQDQLAQLAKTLREISDKIPTDIDWVLRIDGHTDLRPIQTAEFKSNWELSSARAISVVKFLIKEGIPAKRLVAAGFGENYPLDTGRSEEAYGRNRRIELKLTDR